jgi:hypothetical protein
MEATATVPQSEPPQTLNLKTPQGRDEAKRLVEIGVKCGWIHPDERYRVSSSPPRGKGKDYNWGRGITANR